MLTPICKFIYLSVNLLLRKELVKFFVNFFNVDEKVVLWPLLISPLLDDKF